MDYRSFETRVSALRAENREDFRLKDLESRVQKLALDWEAAQREADNRGVVINGPGLLELRERSFDLNREIEEREDGNSARDREIAARLS